MVRPSCLGKMEESKHYSRIDLAEKSPTSTALTPTAPSAEEAFGDIFNVCGIL